MLKQNDLHLVTSIFLWFPRSYSVKVQKKGHSINPLLDIRHKQKGKEEVKPV